MFWWRRSAVIKLYTFTHFGPADCKGQQDPFSSLHPLSLSSYSLFQSPTMLSCFPHYSLPILLSKGLFSWSTISFHPIYAHSIVCRYENAPYISESTWQHVAHHHSRTVWFPRLCAFIFSKYMEIILQIICLLNKE